MQPFRIHKGQVAPLDRANIDTDQIIPKQFLKRIERTGFGEFLFYDWRRGKNGSQDPSFSLNEPRYTGASILVTGRNFGCGSSREHAVWALEDFGFKAVVAPSFADIFYANCTKIGVLPVTLPEEDVRELMKAAEALVDLEQQVVLFDGRDVPFEINPDTRERLLEGLDDISLTLGHAGDIERFER